MDSLKRRLSIVSGSSGRSVIATPDREEQYLLRFYGRHIHVISATVIGGREFHNLRQSLTGVLSNPVKKALYYMTVVRELRELTAEMEKELAMSGRVMREQALFIDQDFPHQLREFFTGDQVVSNLIKTGKSGAVSGERVSLVCNQLVGLRAFM